MRMDKTVVLNRAQLEEAIKSLQGRGSIELSVSKHETAKGQKPIFIRSGGLFQQLRAWLSGESTRKTKADQVCQRLQSVLRNMPGQDQLLQNVRAQIMKEGRLTGEFLALNLKALQEGRVAVAKADLPFQLPAQGQQVRILSGRPTEIFSDHCILGHETAKDFLLDAELEAVGCEQQHLSQIQSWGVGDHLNVASTIHQVLSKNRRTTSIASCPPFGESSAKVRTPEYMFIMIQRAIGDATGRIVIEPQPDRIELGEPAYSDAGLKEQIRAALERKSDAQENGKDRVMAFVSPDPKLLKRIESLHATLIKERQNLSSPDANRFFLDSESDSESEADSDSDSSSRVSSDK